MKLIAITPETIQAAETGHINRLFRAGLAYLHVRKPTADEETTRAFIKGIDSSFYDRIIIHRHVFLWKEMQLGGMHLPLEAFHIRINNTFEGILSASAHSAEECYTLHKPNVHLFISPVFNSISKSDYKATPGLLNLGTLRRRGKLIALGGISSENILEVKEKGFDGAALLGYLWQSDDPLARFLQLQKKLLNDNGS